MADSDGFVGRSVILTWGGAVLKGVREKSVSLNGEAINVTTDENQGWRTLLTVTGENSVDVSVSGVTKSDRLRASYFSGDRTADATLEYPDGGTISGTFFLANYKETGTYNDAVTFEASLQSTRPVSYVAV